MTNPPMDARKTPDLHLRDHGIMQPTCSATRTNGEPCKKKAVTGATVCGTHGGLAPQVRAAGLTRTADMFKTRVDKAFEVLDRALEEDGDLSVAKFYITGQIAIEAARERVENAKSQDIGELKQVATWSDFATESE